MAAASKPEDDDALSSDCSEGSGGREGAPPSGATQRSRSAAPSTSDDDAEQAGHARSKRLQAACDAHEARARHVQSEERRTEAMAQDAACEVARFRQAQMRRLLHGEGAASAAVGDDGAEGDNGAALAALTAAADDANSGWGSGWLGQKQW